MYIRQWVECSGMFYPEYGCEPEEFIEVDDLDISPINLNEPVNFKEF